ncbi:hypothetical protein ASPWEDRAFT_38969 [Aspergillus wentii DTO 134E9]|uniref:SRP9 domain-containing protein n=1 Tax=Aspergillus wentii DTO 134E9 TaxID=1073089 RepID=A0A1L9RR44_ASPWE|nr:uncharacterized protein ASPWEDRAFT_38969 [Aspergillus wentii DTO 134E9]KAI9928230.1 hypothetical protein MW887_002263 [Aspergillus wentii]OJJ37287.1 hypothetical protein ASPWEDRAFT_38969 [Aspergillus wentii DTO 134E9]
MPYLPTSQEYLEQSCLLLEAYPETTRITTKYSFPSKPSPSTSKNAAQSQQQTQQPPATAAPTPPIATLTLKTFNPTSGICLKYQTNKIQEVGRLMTTLGKLAAGSDVAGLGLSNPVPAVSGGGDTEMVDAPVEEATNAGATAGKGEGAKGGKGKKKGGKGKR